MTDEDEKLEKILKWARIQGLESLKNIVEDFDRKDRIIFDEADGETSTSDIADAADVGTGTVSRRLQNWGRMNIVEKDGRQWKHIAPLDAMGLEIPEENNE